MAEGRQKEPLSLNQRHYRFLGDLSASQTRHKTDADDTGSSVNPEIAFDDVPRFDFDSPPLPRQVDLEEPVWKHKGSSPRLFAGIADFDSPSSTLASGIHKSSKITEEDGYSSEADPIISDPDKCNSHLPVDVELETEELQSSEMPAEVVDAAKTKSSLSCNADFDSSFPGEEKQTKVRIEGRRRLCKISERNKSDNVAVKSLVSTERPKHDGISDFDSPLQVNKPHDNNGNEIRDILNDLSSRLEFLSIEKKRVPKKVDLTEDFEDSFRSKLYDVTVKEGDPEYQTATSSNVLFSDSPVEEIGSKVEAVIFNDCSEKTYFADRKENGDVGKTNRIMHKREGHSNVDRMKVPVRLGATKDRTYDYRREEEKYAALSEKYFVKQVGRAEEKFIEVSDDESDDITTLNDDVDEITLSGLKGTYKLPGKIAKMLYPHQREGLKWLWSLHCKGKGGILGDDMGLGKTMQMCSFIAGLFHSNLVRRVLVVAPKTLLTHWINELSTVGLSEKTREYFSTCTKTRHYELQYVLQDKGVLLTTYDIVRNNTKSLCGDYRYSDGEEDEMTWDYMILDEGHLIKNPSTQRAKSLLQIPCRHRIIISGTPLQNNLKELWALFNFCCPELLGDKKEFKEKYEHFISRGNEKNASDREKRIGSSVAKDLRDCIQPYFLRRLKTEVFRDDSTLSKKNEIIIWLPLTQCQRQIYEAFLKSEIVISACDGSPLAALTILKKICDHPLLLTKRAAEDVLEGMDSMVNQEDHRVAEKLAMHIADVAERFDVVDNNDMSCKISFILSLLADLVPNGHNVLIFSQTRKMLNLIQETLTSNRYKYMRIDGTTKVADRAKLVKDFQEGRGAPIFLLTSQVGGLGLTLTNADRVIVVDPAWNPSTDNQSVDRAYRIGQKKDVIVYRLMTCGTVEEKIYRKQVFKGGLFRSATEHKEQIRYFSQQDLKDLFSIPKQGFDISPTQQQLLEEHDRQHTMEESLRVHVEFLETLNIAGVSHHSLLFSKPAHLEAVEIEEETERPRVSRFVGNAFGRPSFERDVDGGRSQYAFNPMDIKKVQRNANPDVKEPTEYEIRERIDRLSQIFSNKVAISRLPDRGEKIHRQISSLYHQLDQLQMARASANKDDIIELASCHRQRLTHTPTPEHRRAASWTLFRFICGENLLCLVARRLRRPPSPASSPSSPSPESSESYCVDLRWNPQISPESCRVALRRSRLTVASTSAGILSARQPMSCHTQLTYNYHTQKPRPRSATIVSHSHPRAAAAAAHVLPAAQARPSSA
ncbi:Protein CHROMATIN REMODELING 24 [Striga hermonthica]|uniref:Protein CHROMATIN REMODELING 24 n=1 Tax=Striga hermonthica TaxID=68872 RepID=A0A9N7NTW2_STRHE|nr:Protein CHROMATIN REMODELING 24 [Striga hermonthica]